MIINTKTRELAELLVWECRERYKFQKNECCLSIAAVSMSFARMILEADNA